MCGVYWLSHLTSILCISHVCCHHRYCTGMCLCVSVCIGGNREMATLRARHTNHRIRHHIFTLEKLELIGETEFLFRKHLENSNGASKSRSKCGAWFQKNWCLLNLSTWRRSLKIVILLRNPPKEIIINVGKDISTNIFLCRLIYNSSKLGTSPRSKNKRDCFKKWLSSPGTSKLWPLDQPSFPSVFVNKVLLAHYHGHSFMYYLGYFGTTW